MMEGAVAMATGALAGAATGAGVAAVAFRSDRVIAFRLASVAPSRSRGEAPAHRRCLRRVARWKVMSSGASSANVRQMLAMAGWGLTPPELRAAQWVSGFGTVVLGAAAGALTDGAWLLLPVFAAAGYRAPRLAAARAARRRRARADLEVPQFLDLLAAASTAGLGPHGALTRAAAATSGPLRQELMRFLAEVELGARWRDGLRRLTERLDLPDLRRAVQAMVRTERLGSSLADALRELADEVREERRSQATERARKAPVKMLFPLVFMILPAFLLLTVVPVLISTLRSIR